MIWRRVATAAVVLAAATATPMLFEDRFLFYPEREIGASPADLGLAHEEVWLDTHAGRVHVWILPGRGRAELLFFHGNAGTIADRLPHAARFVRLGLDVLLVEYPGYGKSEGEPSEASMRAAADRALALARARGAKVVAFGESLGAAVAVDLAARHQLDGVIVQSAFTSVADMARVVFPWLPFRPPVKNRFDSLAKIAAIGAPKLFIHGDADEVVPPEQGLALHRAAADPKDMVIVAGAHHNDTWLVDERRYFEAVDAFLRAHGMP